jgi:hypothetical protein
MWEVRVSEFAAFNPEDPDDIVADMFRRQVTQLALNADKVTLYREMPSQRQLECFVAGALTGIVGVAFAHVKPEGYDAIMSYIADCLPFARIQAEGVRDPAVPSDQCGGAE